MRKEFVVLKERKFYINIFVVIFILRFLILHGKIKSSGKMLVWRSSIYEGLWGFMNHATQENLICPVL